MFFCTALNGLSAVQIRVMSQQRSKMVN